MCSFVYETIYVCPSYAAYSNTLHPACNLPIEPDSIKVNSIKKIAQNHIKDSSIYLNPNITIAKQEKARLFESRKEQDSIQKAAETLCSLATGFHSKVKKETLTSNEIQNIRCKRKLTQLPEPSQKLSKQCSTFVYVLKREEKPPLLNADEWVKLKDIFLNPNYPECGKPCLEITADFNKDRISKNPKAELINKYTIPNAKTRYFSKQFV